MQHYHLIVSLIFVLLSNGVLAQKQQQPETVNFKAHLSDRSILYGTVQPNPIEVYTTFGKTAIALDLINQIQFKESGTKLILKNGDKLTASVIDEKLSVYSEAMGELFIRFDKIQSISFYGAANGLVSYFPFSGTFNDQLGGNNGQSQNYGATLVSDANGPGNDAYRFDGNDYMHFGSDPIEKDGDITFMANVNPSTNQAAYIMSTGAQNGSEVGFAILRRANGKIWVARTTSKSYCYSGDVGYIPVNAWSQIAGAYDAQTDKLIVYVNGQKMGEFPGVKSTNPDQYKDFTIGKPNTTNSNYFQGMIDEVRIYDRSLSAEEIDLVTHEVAAQGI